MFPKTQDAEDLEKSWLLLADIYIQVRTGQIKVNVCQE